MNDRSPTPARDRTVLPLAFLWLALTAWLRPLALPDEGRYVGVAWEMLRSGDWLVPTLDGLPYFHKPPLFYWLTAGALSLSPSSLLAARIAPLVGAWLAAASLFLFVRRWRGDRLAIASLVALVTAPLFFFGAQFANLDMLVGGCITATILAYAHVVLLGPDAPERRRALLLAYALCALGVLAKGLIGVVLPGMVLFLWLVVERRWRDMLRLLWPPGIVLFLVIASPWFVAMQGRFAGFAHYFFVVQHFQRYSQTGFNNAQPAWFYVAVLAVLALPWTAWLLRSPALAWREPSTAGAIRRLMGVWIAAITLFFSLPQSKLVGYIFPVVAPLLYLAADAALAVIDRAPTRSRLWRGCAIGAALLCIVAAVGITVKADRSQTEIGRALRSRVQPGDAVIALDEYWFAVPFEARLREPVAVVSDWSPASVASRDNWRRELADAAVFEPKADWLIGAGQLPQRICSRPTAWLVGEPSAAKRYEFLAQAEAVATSRKLTLWRIAPGSPLRGRLCPGTPSANSAGRS